MFNPNGIYVAMMTPFDDEGRVNLDEARRMTEFFIEKGVDGIFPVSNVGEFIQLERADKLELVRAVVQTARGRARVTPGISAPGTRESIRLGESFADAGADGLVLSAPYYFKYPPDAVKSGLKAVIRDLDTPIILYNIPLYANPVEPAAVAELMQYPNLAAIKESSGSTALLLELLSRTRRIRDDFCVLVGWEEMLASSLMLGANGCMTASAGIFPEIMCSIYSAVKGGNMDQAVRLQSIIEEATRSMKTVFFPLGYRFAMQARGFELGPYAVELDNLYTGERDLIAQAVEHALAEFRLFQKDRR